MSTKVLGGNRPAFRQLETDCGLRLVSSAVLKVPPRASMMSSVVNCMTPNYMPNEDRSRPAMLPGYEYPQALEPEMLHPDMIGGEPTSTPDVAARLRSSRLALKLTQARLCIIAGIATNAWNNVENGRSRISVDAAIKLCQATGLTLEWIYRGVRVGLPVSIAEALREVEKTPPHIRDGRRRKPR